jgi:hypothetical protein
MDTKTASCGTLNLSMKTVSKPGAILEVKAAEIPPMIQDAINRGLAHGKEIAVKQEQERKATSR